MKIQHTAIVGMGALGLLYGPHIQQAAGPGSVCFVMDAPRLEKHRRDRYTINGQPQEFPQAHGPELSLMEDFLVIGIQLQHRFFRCRTRFFLFSLQKLRYLHWVHLPVSFRPGWNGLLPEGGTRDPAGCFPRSISIRYTESTRPMPTRVMIREVPP